MRSRNYSRRPSSRKGGDVSSRGNSPPHNTGDTSTNHQTPQKRKRSTSCCQRMTNWASLLFFPAPPKFKTSHGRRKTLCLDLDETLVHTNAVFETLEGHLPPTLRLDVENNSNRHSSSKNRIFYVRIRPHLSVFLKECMKLFEVVVFTASEKSYADPIIASIFHEADCNIPRQCYYRPSCDAVMGMHIKDLSKVRHDLSKVILLDNSTSAAAYQPTNLMTISSWYGAENDTELLDTLELLKVLSTVSDVRNILNLRLSQRIEQVSMTSG